jgi:hypothetical protein
VCVCVYVCGVQKRAPQLVAELVDAGLAFRAPARHVLRLVASCFASHWTISATFTDQPFKLNEQGELITGEESDTDADALAMLHTGGRQPTHHEGEHEQYQAATHAEKNAEDGEGKQQEEVEEEVGDEEDDRQVLRPWIKPDGEVNLDLLHSLFFKLITMAIRYPGIPRDRLVNELRVLGEVHVRDVVDALVQESLLRVEEVQRTTPSVFGGHVPADVQHSIYASVNAVDSFDHFPTAL